MKTYISNSGISFNKLVKDKFTVGIRTDKRADKLFGIRPNTSDNNDYQLEVTFNKFMSSNGLIGNGDIYTRFNENDNKINLSDNTILETSDRSFKHYIDIGDIEDDIFMAEYVIDYRGYELDTKKLSTFNLDKPIFKGIKFIEIGQTITDINRDYNYDYIWLEKNFENYTYNSTNYKLMDYITDNYKWKEYNKLKMDLGYLTEPRYLNFDIDKNVEYKYCGGQLKFKSNNFKVKTIKINRPTFYDEEYNKSEYEGDNIIVINNSNQIKYYKIPSYETIFYKLIEKSKYLDVSGSLTGSITYNDVTTDGIVPVLLTIPVAEAKDTFVGKAPEATLYVIVAPASGSVATNVVIVVGYVALELSYIVAIVPEAVCQLGAPPQSIAPLSNAV